MHLCSTDPVFFFLKVLWSQRPLFAVDCVERGREVRERHSVNIHRAGVKRGMTASRAEGSEHEELVLTTTPHNPSDPINFDC